MPPLLSPFTGLYTLILAGVFYDVQERRVPQLINALLLGSGALYQISQLGLGGILESALGVMMALALLIVPFALYVYRGGDVKLCMGVGAWLGWEQTLWFIAYGILLGGLLGAGALAVKKLSGAQKEQPSTETVPMALAFGLSALYVTL